MKLAFKSDNCADVLAALLPETFEDMDKCREWLRLTRSIFNDGYKWNIVHNDEIVCLILGNEMLCKYVKED